MWRWVAPPSGGRNRGPSEVRGCRDSCGHKKTGVGAPVFKDEDDQLAEVLWSLSPLVPRIRYCASNMFRECFNVRVTARWCFAESPVYLRGRILPVSVT